MVRLPRMLMDMHWCWSGARDRLAQGLAADCRAEVIDRVWPRASQMTVSQARGYVWARVAGQVEREADRMVQDGRVQVHRCRSLAFRAAEILVEQVLEATVQSAGRVPSRRTAA